MNGDGGAGSIPDAGVSTRARSDGDAFTLGDTASHASAPVAERDQETGIGAVVLFIRDVLTRIGILIRAHVTCILSLWIVGALLAAVAFIAAVLMDLYMRKRRREEEEED